MSPKSLLRNPLAISRLNELSENNFQEVINEKHADPKSIKRVLICSGKVYYDLVNKRTELNRPDVAIVRLEQLYPFAEAKMAEILNQYSQADLMWVQEEPKNMGAWNFIFNYWNGGLSEFRIQVGNRELRYSGRDWAASPAVGSPKIHEQETKAFLEQAFKN
jgi:2-oxoglutarate dehydrogenase E1 component